MKNDFANMQPAWPNNGLIGNTMNNSVVNNIGNVGIKNNSIPNNNNIGIQNGLQNKQSTLLSNNGNMNMINTANTNTNLQTVQNAKENSTTDNDFSKTKMADAVNKIIMTAVNVGASDIHFDPIDNDITVKLKLDNLPIDLQKKVTQESKVQNNPNDKPANNPIPNVQNNSLNKNTEDKNKQPTNISTNKEQNKGANTTTNQVGKDMQNNVQNKVADNKTISKKDSISQPNNNLIANQSMLQKNGINQPANITPNNLNKLSNNSVNNKLLNNQPINNNPLLENKKLNNNVQTKIPNNQPANNTTQQATMANNKQNTNVNNAVSNIPNNKQQSTAGTTANLHGPSNKHVKLDKYDMDPNYTKTIDFTKMPVVDAVNKIIITAVNVGASDIHFDPTDKGITVRLRIDGVLNDFFYLPYEIKQNATTRIKIMAGMNITETRLPQDGGIRDRINDRDLDLRVSSLPTKRGEKIVIRILDYSMSLQGVESLCFNETNYNKILKMLNNPNGIILVTGATGTGKSTTLYSFLQKLNVEGTNIITVEDPVEMDIAGINQVQVNSDIGLDFAAVLRSILRQDPNIIMVGEIRDSETAKIAVRASITGHLVISTIHTNNSLNTIERLLDMDVERYLLASALTGIVSQQLARKLCDKCKTKRVVNDVEKRLFKTVLKLDINEVYEPNKNGCPHCNRGYKGRIALHEVLLINQDIRDAISSGMRKEQLRELVYGKSVITMLQDGLYKIIAGFTTSEEILKLIEVDDEDFGIKKEETATK